MMQISIFAISVVVAVIGGSILWAVATIKMAASDAEKAISIARSADAAIHALNTRVGNIENRVAKAETIESRVAKAEATGEAEVLQLKRDIAEVKRQRG